MRRPHLISHPGNVRDEAGGLRVTPRGYRQRLGLRCVADARELYAVERNTLARLLIDGEDVAALVCGKAFGVGVVVGVLCELRHNGYRHSSVVTVAVAVAQAAVAVTYLF